MNDLLLTELEVQLAAPSGFMLKQQHLQQLDVIAWRLLQRMQTGVTRDEFPILEALTQAVHAAQQVLTDWPVPAQTAITFNQPRST